MKRPFRVRICCGSPCVAQGALEVLQAFREVAIGSSSVIDVAPRAETVGCRGFCSQGVLVELPDLDVLYCRVTVDDVPEIVDRTVTRGEIVEELLYLDPATGRRCRGLADNPFFSLQNRRLLARCGVVDPEEIDDALALGAYRGLRRALAELEPGGVVDLVKLAGLQERGGPGFPVGFKWTLVAEAPGAAKVVVGNGEGGDPGIDVDRTLLEGDPHGVLEGMVIAGFAVGAAEGRLFLGSTSSLVVARAERAIAQARREGLLGRAILGSTFAFDIEVREAAGASMGGEETALLNCLQGRRAVARPRPPFPTVSGLWGRPTLINTLETLANIPLIVAPRDIRDGGDDRRVGGTKIFGLAGSVNRPGLIEVDLGAPVGEIVEDLGGGVGDGRRLIGVHVGGPAGATLGREHLDIPLDYPSLRSFDSNLGSGGLVVLDDTTCVVSFARYLVAFCAGESCGTCPPCRIGTRVLLNLLDRIMDGRGKTADLDRLERLSAHIRRTSMCELGRNAPNPIITGLRHFRDDYEAHVGGRGCPAGECPASPSGGPG